MTKPVSRCMLCGKPSDTASTICSSCQESVRGEAVGKQKKIVKQAEKEIKQHGQMPHDPKK